jgi:hypothetical protein
LFTPGDQLVAYWRSLENLDVYQTNISFHVEDLDFVIFVQDIPLIATLRLNMPPESRRS